MAAWPYNTATWKRLRKAKLAANPLCEYCRDGKVTTANQVDHKVPIKAGGEPFGWDNLASSCQSCHSRKTALMDGGYGRERSDRMVIRGCDKDGQPLDPNHWWNSKISRS